MPRKYTVRLGWPTLALSAAVSLLAPSVFAQSPAAQRGLTFVRTHCAQCHAIDKVSESPLAIAPPFRTLHLKYPVSDLQRLLAQGVHPVMPRFQFEASQVEDIMAYLKTLERSDPPNCRPSGRSRSR